MRIFLQISLIQYILLGGQNFSTWGTKFLHFWRTKFLHLEDEISPFGGRNFSIFGGRNFSIFGGRNFSIFGGRNFSIWRTKFLHLEDKNFFPLGSCKNQKQWFTIFVATVFWMDYFFFSSFQVLKK